MKTVDHFRHSMRPPNGVHLTLEGVKLARRVGEKLGPYDRVVTSEIPRAIETAIAMGYGVDAEIPLLGSLVSFDSEVDWTAGCTAFAEAYRRGGQAALAAQAHAGMVREQVALLPDGGSMLMVSHGGMVELA